MIRAAALIVATIGVMSASTQAVPVTRLGEPAVEFKEPFSSVRGVVELPNGQLIVSDIRERTLQRIDFDNQRAAAIGRHGSGPAEYGLASRMFVAAGDSVYVFDPEQGRHLVISPDGRAVRTYRAPAGETPRAGDKLGRLYFTSASGLGADDSALIVRVNPATGMRERIGRLWQPPPSAPQSSTSGGQSIVSTRFGGAPYQNGDEWVVFPDGRVVIARVTDYHLEILFPDGRKAQGPAVPYVPLRITEAEKRAWRLETAAQTVSVSESATGARQVTVGAGRSLPEPEYWPDVMSPFLTGALWAAPNGDTWVFPSRQARDTVPVADVFNTLGIRIKRIVLPARVRVVAVGARGVYVVRTDSDGLEYLRRYPMK